MSITVADLDAIPARTAASFLANCCGSSRWVSEMVSARPFGSRDAVLTEADRIWTSLDASDWLEAFAHHPRIGERTGAVPQGELGGEWSEEEQAGIDDADDDAHRVLATLNQEYERRFGFIYIVCATGKTPEEMMELAGQRLRNDGATELRLAADEQRKITRIRLQKLLEEEK